MFSIVIAILFAVYYIMVGVSEGFSVRLDGLRSNQLSLYPTKGESGGEKRYNMFEPYLRQSEPSSHEQADNHKWPTGRTLAGSPEQSLSSAPVLPCDYPRPHLGGEKIHNHTDALSRNKLTHSSFRS